jgi:hypothetical protein
MPHRTIRGAILYTSRKPDRYGQERGREYFMYTDQADGIRSIHAHCEIDDAPNVVRDVLMAVDSSGRPLDATVRLTVGDRFEGVGSMRFSDSLAECDTLNRRDGRLTQRLDTREHVRALGAHPICCDALTLRLYDLSRGPGRDFYPDLMLTSPDHRGATGPLLFRVGFGLEYVGDETVTVAAGTFTARHFRYVDTAGQLPEEHPPYDVWCTADDDYVFLKGEVGGYMQTYYELTELVDNRRGR